MLDSKIVFYHIKLSKIVYNIYKKKNILHKSLTLYFI